MIKTFICPLGHWHVRLHIIENVVPVTIADCGFAMPSPCDVKSSEEKVRTRLENADACLCAEVISIDGKGESGYYMTPPNSNLIHPRTAIPFITKNLGAGKHCIINGFYGNARRPDATPNVVVEGDEMRISLGEAKVSFSMLQPNT